MIHQIKQGVTKVKRAVMRSRSPLLPPEWDEADAQSLKALQRGDASQYQQQRALKWIVETACGTYDLAYRPGGMDGDRDTSFALGRQFVGQQIVKLLKINLSFLRRNDG